jgi:hypothetical protein
LWLFVRLAHYQLFVGDMACTFFTSGEASWSKSINAPNHLQIVILRSGNQHRIQNELLTAAETRLGLCLPSGMWLHRFKSTVIFKIMRD